MYIHIHMYIHLCIKILAQIAGILETVPDVACQESGRLSKVGELQQSRWGAFRSWKVCSLLNLGIFLPRGSKYPSREASGPKYCTYNVFWAFYNHHTWILKDPLGLATL